MRDKDAVAIVEQQLLLNLLLEIGAYGDALGANVDEDVLQTAVFADHQGLIADVELPAAFDVFVNDHLLTFRGLTVVHKFAGQISP